MSTTYKIYEDERIEITVGESSTRYDMSINFKGKSKTTPFAFLELFNEESLPAYTLADMGANMLYAAFLQMEQTDVEAFKRRVEAM